MNMDKIESEKGEGHSKREEGKWEGKEAEEVSKGEEGSLLGDLKIQSLGREEWAHQRNRNEEPER